MTITLPKKNILILDDQSLILSVHKAIINGLSNIYELYILTVNNREEAQSIVKCVSLDLIISDHLMQDVGSESFISYVRASNKNKHVPIIVATAVKDATVHATLSSLGASACILKPVHKIELLEVSKRLLNDI